MVGIPQPFRQKAAVVPVTFASRKDARATLSAAQLAQISRQKHSSTTAKKT